MTHSNMGYEEYSISTSLQLVGPLTPVLKDKSGNTIDGFHRLQEDPNWPTMNLPQIDSPLKHHVARLIANDNRRIMGRQEKTDLLKQITEAHMVERGVYPTAQQLSEMLGKQVAWIREYLPERFKEAGKAEAGKAGGVAKAAKRRLAEGETRTWKERFSDLEGHYQADVEQAKLQASREADQYLREEVEGLRTSKEYIEKEKQKLEWELQEAKRQVAETEAKPSQPQPTQPTEKETLYMQPAGTTPKGKYLFHGNFTCPCGRGHIFYVRSPIELGYADITFIHELLSTW